MPDPGGCQVDFILTDPPYIANYKSRTGQRVANDDNATWLKPSFAQMHRILKPDAFAISFYGWPKIDLFMAAWKGAGFRVAGHIIFRKRYASKKAFVNYRHEAAYLLIKGNPAFPATPIDDVRDWIYSGNKFHPTQKSIHILRPLIETFSKPGDLVLDPFAGSGSTLKAAAITGRDLPRHRNGCQASRDRDRPPCSPDRTEGSMTFNGNLDNFVLFERIARERTDIATLRRRGRDDLDFHGISIWALLDMLQAAYDAGVESREEPR